LCLVFGLAMSRTYLQYRIAPHHHHLLQCCQNQLGNQHPRSLASLVGCPGPELTKRSGWDLKSAIGRSNHPAQMNPTLADLPDIPKYRTVVVANRSWQALHVQNPDRIAARTPSANPPH